MSSELDPSSLRDDLEALAREGIEDADDAYERRRHERILDIASELPGESTELPPDPVRESLRETFGEVTHKVGAAAVVFDEEGRVLLMRRADSDVWCLPAGMTDPGESIRTTAVRETKEETGLDVGIDELVGLYESPPGVNGPHHFLGVAYRCSVVGGELQVSFEGEELSYREPKTVRNWFSDHADVVRDAVEQSEF